MKKISFFWACVACLQALPLLASNFFVAPTGSASGNGSLEKPWDLATALAQPSAVNPGDSIWLRGGMYVGHFTSTLKGSANKPIIVRQYQGERATLDGNDGTNSVTLLIKGSDAWFWGFEVTNSNAARTSIDKTPPSGRGEAVNLLGARTKLINMALHDTGQGVLTTTDFPDTEVSGCLIYYNGYDGTDRGHGHGIYIQNVAPSTKHVVDNIIFDQFGIGIHAYTEGGKLDNLDFEGNTLFNNGGLSQVTGLTTDILVGASGSAVANPGDSGKVAKNTVLRNNYTYFSSPGGIGTNLGFSKGIASPTVIDNYLVGGVALTLINAFRPITMTGNSLYGTLTGFQSSEFPNNTYYSARPTGLKVFVRPNKYESGRANITIYNWDKAPTVDVSLQAIMPHGTHYELRNAQDFFGAPVLSGVYDGSPLHVPMTGLAAATPVGRPAPPPTGPDFQAFVLVPTAPPKAARGRVEPPSDTPGTPVSVQRGAVAAALERAASPTAAVTGGLQRARNRVYPVRSGEVSQEPSPCAIQQHLGGGDRAEPSRATDPASRLPSATRYYPQVATSGRNPSCATSLSVTNTGLDPTTVTLTFLEHDRDNLSAPTVTLVIASGESIQTDDVLRNVFGVAETYGAIELQTGLSESISAAVQSISGSASQRAARTGAHVFANESAPSATLRGLRQDARIAADILLLNPNLCGAVVSVTLVDAAMGPSGTTFVLIPPRGYVRRDLVSLFPSTGIGSAQSLSVAVDAGTLPVFAFASVLESAQPGTEPIVENVP